MFLVAFAGADDDDGDNDGKDDATHGTSVAVIRRPGRIVIARQSVVDDAIPRPPRLRPPPRLPPRGVPALLKGWNVLIVGMLKLCTPNVWGTAALAAP